MNHQQRPVKGGVTALSGEKFGGVEGEREPAAMLPLLKDSTNVGVRGVSSEADSGSGIWMGEGGWLGQGQTWQLGRMWP